MERIGGGWSKHVYALNKDQVLKVPRKEVGEFGRYSMRAETWMWENVPDEHRFWLADVIAYDRQGRWMIQERIAPIEQDPPQEMYDALTALGIKEVKFHNLGKRKDGSTVLFDWGSGTYYDHIENGYDVYYETFGKLHRNDPRRKK